MKCDVRRQKVIVSKKVPIPGVQYSSQTYGIEMEVEFTPTDETPQELGEKSLKVAERMKKRLEDTVDRWICGEEEPDDAEPVIPPQPPEDQPADDAPETVDDPPADELEAGQAETEEHLGPEWLEGAWKSYMSKEDQDPPPSTREQIQYLMDLTDRAERKQIYAKCGISSLQDLTVEQASNLIDSLKDCGKGYQR